MAINILFILEDWLFISLIGYTRNIHDTYLHDLRLQDMGLESKLGEALLKHEWIHAVVLFQVLPQAMELDELFTESGTFFSLVESGIHVFFKQKVGLELSWDQGSIIF